jgi:hypothetical protein
MKRGFSATTFILVAVLFGALFMVGHMVVPPPPGPPAPPPSETSKPGDPMVAQKPGGPSADMRAKQMEEMKKRMTMAQKNKTKQLATKKFDPNTIEITPSWHEQRAPGEEGNKQMAIKVAEAKAEIAKERAQQQAKPPVTPAAKTAQ